MTVKYINSKELFLAKISKKIKQTDVVLDIGCGIQPQKYIKPIVHICAEPYGEYADYLLKKIGNKNRFFIILKQKWDEIIKIIPKEGVDTVISLDVIEHLEKEEGERLLKETIPLAKKQIIIFTPYGFMPQEVPDGMKDAWGLDGAEWQRHKSGWTEKDFGKEWDIYICEKFHFNDAITNEEFEKPYGAMFAILNKNIKGKTNTYSLVRKICGVFSLNNKVYLFYYLIYIARKIGLYKYLSPLWRKYILKNKFYV